MNGAQGRGLEQFALRYLRANGSVARETMTKGVDASQLGTPTPFVLRYRSMNGVQGRGVEQFALRYLRANG
jgi:hypothetical protein